MAQADKSEAASSRQLPRRVAPPNDNSATLTGDIDATAAQFRSCQQEGKGSRLGAFFPRQEVVTEKSSTEKLSGPEHRRSSRYPVVVPLEVNWREANGAQFKESAQATEVNAHGALLQMRNYPTMGVEAELKNLLTAQKAQARMAAVRRSRGGAIQGIAVELLAPNESFWGLNFQLRKASAELLTLEQGIKSGEIDPLILRDFRDAVDHVRKTAWAVQEWRERQIQHRDPSTVLSLLTLERIRRATTLTHDLLGDLKAQDVSHRTEGIADLHRAIVELHKRLAEYFEAPAT